MKTATQLTHQLHCDGVIRDAMRGMTDAEVVALLIRAAIGRLPDNSLDDLSNKLGLYPHIRLRDLRTAEAICEVIG